jgi:diguanylate cyclase (GGDEF)-like protein
MEPNFGLSIYDSNIKLNTGRYSKNMEVIYSSENGEAFKGEQFSSRELIPGYKDDGNNHLYVFLPLHEEESSYGYIVFKDCRKLLERNFLRIYYNRMSLALEKFRYALTLEHINQRLLDLMGRDPLTNVNNRMAYEDKEKYLQGQINSEPDISFALAMFDVNSLKLINDSQGHEAGDAYLLRTCHLICQTFKHSPVYRIGGDEFVAVLTGEDYDNRDSLIKTLNEMMSPYSDSLPLPPDYVSIACGLSAYNSGTDNSVSDVINRADEEMYKDKAKKKGIA